MAEGWSSSVLCRYYLNGCCREGANCRFSHDRQSSQPSNICRYYQKGHCAYGEHCRYDHVKSTPSSTTAATSHSVAQNGTSQPHSLGKPSSSNTAANIANKITPPCLGKSLSPSSSQEGKMTVLKRQQVQSSDSGYGEDSSSSSSSPSPLQSNMSKWVEAPEFIPTTLPNAGNKTYAAALFPEGKNPDGWNDETPTEPLPIKSDDILCPYFIMGECRFGDKCLHLHGEVCELCSQACLHPSNEKQRRAHREDCMKAHEQDMELSFAIARSKDKMCSICMDVIMEKFPIQERRFGILPNCTHVFCLSCIRTWRGTKQLENKTVRSCPECRTPSDYVAPSKYWVESKEDKEKLIEDYKKALSQKPCKYFKQGNGECPFAGNCFYLHAYPDGKKANLPPPRPRRWRNADGNIEFMQHMLLWDFMAEREERWLFQFDLEDMLELFSDESDDSIDDYSDFDY